MIHKKYFHLYNHVDWEFKMKNLNLPSLLTLKKEIIGKKIYIAYKNKKNIMYVSFLWRLISIIYNLIPQWIFKKL